ncbi:MAG: DNA polymerase-3 subunit alpha [Bradymonadia bacterium]|jgi:DNA polymerase-3 subunit alpha
MATDFVHLHVHSHYSLLDSTVKLPALASRVAELGMDAVAVTDHGNMYGAVELQWKCGKEVRPIFGVEVWVVEEREEARAKPYHLVLLAETLAGYRNLLRLVSRGWVSGLDRRNRPLVTWGELDEFAGGLIALTGDIGGEVPQHLLRGERDKAIRTLSRLRKIYGEDNLFLELTRAEGLPETEDACQLLVDLAEEMRLPYVATNNVHYLNNGDHEAHAVLMCIGMDKRIDKSIIDKIPMTSLYLKSPDEMADLFKDLPKAISNTRVIADRCRVVIPLGEYFLPAFPVPEGMDENGYLRTVAQDGLEDRFAQFEAAGKTVDKDVYRDRLEVELKIIIQMGFPGYFLIVWDFIKWTKDQEIPVGPGRGSGAGSLVAYSLLITDLDPLPYGLLFERFLNPERVSMPDFDIDFCQNRRGEVIDYVVETYGKENVGQIVTFGQLKAKAAVRDVARVLNLPFAEADRLAKLVPDELNIKLADAYDKEPRFREAVESDETLGFLYKTALALEGNNRNTGMHAAGVVISGEPLWETVPVSIGSSDELVTQYAKNEVEAAGLVKFDFLGLKTLTVIDDAVRMVNAKRSAEDALDFSKLSLDTSQVYDLIKVGDTTGIFQMESDGFQKLMRRLKPDCFEDIVAAVALYRPGPLGSGMVDQFIDCKHGRREVEYPHVWLTDVLEETYGVMVYQEQVMKTAQILAGYTLGGADLLRRAMGKKKASEMDRQREIFVEGAGKKDIDARKANEVFDLMAHFAGYGFNKSHSAAYAVLTFQTGYLKAFHPSEFYASLMSNDASSTDKVVKYILDARSRNIQVLPPDAFASAESFTVSDGVIRFGLGAVKGLGSSPIEGIVDARADGPFESLFDFCERVDLKRCNKRVLEALVRCGALDSTFSDDKTAEGPPSLKEIGRRRARMFAAIDSAVDRGAKAQRDKESGQTNLFGIFAVATPKAAPIDSYPEVRGWSDTFVLTCEKETLGFYVSGHPLDRYRDEIAHYADCDSSRIHTKSNRDTVSLAGVIASKRERPLKSGNGRMAFLQFEDHYGEIEILIYARLYPDVQEMLDSDEPLLIRGKVRIDGDDEDRAWKVAAEEIKPLSDARSQRVNQVVIDLDVDQVTSSFLNELETIFSRHPGSCRAVLTLNYGTAAAEMVLADAVGVASSDELVHDLSEVIGDTGVRFR